ncbi:WAT1-related protein At4g08300 [Amborella trichopoda]|uniref:WAT1-related protein At4g08300 n=1 Tax=Amborella trichopoda TaxID=13333 RepID=UPI0009BF223D|nr:WAT1-related protein At4g08300 [Amborella trichopoda]|eukprot:XP_020522292.1 WAT1-related protein At4g08300 [Amborella trichopoda]
MEKLQLKKRTGQAKVVGIFLCVGGAMVITLYKGYALHTSTYLKTPKAILKLLGTPHSSSVPSQTNWILGSILCTVSITSWSAWIMYQAAAFKDYPANISLTALMCFMGTIQCSVITLFMDNPKDWRLGWNLSLFAYAYSGVACTAIGNLVQTWCIREKGPVFAAAFNPVSTVVVAILEPLLLHVDTHVGSILGAAMVIFGLYFVLWAKAKDYKVKANETLPDCPVKENNTNVKIRVENKAEENNAKGMVQP